jgi:hypothetical protein
MYNTALNFVPVETVFQFDGAPLHFSRCARVFLSVAPSFSVFNSSEIFFWMFVKDTVYCEKVRNVNKLRDRIVKAAKCITNEMFASTYPEAKYHLDVCRATNGAHIEIF